MLPLYYLDFTYPGLASTGAVRAVPRVSDAADRRLSDGASSLRALGAAHAHHTLLLHGFNVPRDKGAAAYRELAQRVSGAAPQLSTCFVGVLWPGNAPIVRALSYPFEEGPADKTAVALTTTLAAYVRPRGMSLVAHSLGCRVALRSLELLAPELDVDEAVLHAGAVDGDALARDDRYRAGVERVSRMTVVSSTADKTLHWAFPIGDFVASLLHGGYTRTALGRGGPSPTPTRGVPADVLHLPVGTHDVDHGDYMPPDAVPARPQPVRIAQLTADALVHAMPQYRP